MPVQGCFSVPIYYSLVQKYLLSSIQHEFSVAKEDLDNKNSFNYKEGWEPGTHQISDVEFSKNLFQDYNFPVFLKELDHHIKLYLTSVSIPTTTEYKIVSSWMTKTRKNEYAHLHNHGRSDISGVYYYKTNGVDGSIRFKNPLSQFSTFLLENVRADVMYPPIEGRLILFPGWLDHSVETNNTDHERISISFNINLRRPEF